MKNSKSDSLPVITIFLVCTVAVGFLWILAGLTGPGKPMDNWILELMLAPLIGATVSYLLFVGIFLAWVIWTGIILLLQIVKRYWRAIIGGLFAAFLPIIFLRLTGVMSGFEFDFRLALYLLWFTVAFMDHHGREEPDHPQYLFTMIWLPCLILWFLSLGVR